MLCWDGATALAELHPWSDGSKWFCCGYGILKLLALSSEAYRRRYRCSSVGGALALWRREIHIWWMWEMGVEIWTKEPYISRSEYNQPGGLAWPWKTINKHPLKNCTCRWLSLKQSHLHTCLNFPNVPEGNTELTNMWGIVALKKATRRIWTENLRRSFLDHMQYAATIIFWKLYQIETASDVCNDTIVMNLKLQTVKVQKC